MRVNPLTCDEFADNLADLLERDVDEPMRAAAEAHAVACIECGSLLADLRKLSMDAASLPVLSPSRDLWEGIAGRIDAPVIPITREGARGSRLTEVYRGRRHWVGVGAAAAALVVVTASVTYLATRTIVRGPQAVATNPLTVPAKVVAAPREAAATAPTVQPPTTIVTANEGSGSAAGGARARLASNRKPSAEATYDTEIARLRTIVDQRRTQLDPATVGIVERNLKVIDDAISQCRTALHRDPASRFLMESLNSALEHKVELLRTAAMLPSRT
jgi:hypothetical protein